jgi:hypothetical protein
MKYLIILLLLTGCAAAKPHNNSIKHYVCTSTLRGDKISTNKVTGPVDTEQAESICRRVMFLVYQVIVDAKCVESE